jgi:hypothetical protein
MLMLNYSKNERINPRFPFQANRQLRKTLPRTNNEINNPVLRSLPDSRGSLGCKLVNNDFAVKPVQMTGFSERQFQDGGQNPPDEYKKSGVKL